MYLKDKYSLITGAGRGIGKAVALEYAKNGANVAVTARTKTELDETVKEICSHGVEGFSISADLSTLEGLKKCAAEYFDQFDNCDILVNNAGISHYSSIVDIPIEDAQKLFNLNIFGYYAMTKFVIENMLERGSGKIIMTSSPNGNITFTANKSAYSTSKAAETAMTKCLDAEVGKRNIHVNAVLPGPVETKMLQDNRDWGAKYPEGDPPEAIAPIYLFLASDIIKRPYRGMIIDHYSLFQLVSQIRAEIQDEKFNIRDLQKDMKDKLSKEASTIFRKNRDLIEFLLTYKG